MSMNQDKIQELLSEITLEEKAGLCSGADMFTTQAVERLNIPAFTMSDGPHGLRKQMGKQDFMGQNASVAATCFPAACATGSSFDPDLVEQIGHALGKNCQKEEVQVLLGPGINIKRSPLCGRNFEYFSEDPYVSGTLGTAYVKGLQAEGVGACLKHFLANNQENRRRTQSSNPDERTLREIYAAAFEQVVKEAKPWSVMASYNRLHGTYATENGTYLKDLLRDEWGFEGMAVSDWAAVHDRTAAVKARCALTMPGDKEHDRVLAEAVRGRIVVSGLSKHGESGLKPADSTGAGSAEQGSPVSESAALSLQELDLCCGDILRTAFTVQSDRNAGGDGRNVRIT